MSALKFILNEKKLSKIEKTITHICVSAFASLIQLKYIHWEGSTIQHSMSADP